MRKRQLHPEFWLDKKISRLTVESRLAFLWSLNAADDEGRFRCDAETLSSAVFRYDEMPKDEAASVIAELVELGRWMPYVKNGEEYYLIPHWHSWQSINRPTISKLPEPAPQVYDEYEEKFGPIAKSREDARSVVAGPRSAGLYQSKKLSKKTPAKDENDAAVWEVFCHWRDASEEVSLREGRRNQGRKRVLNDKRKRLIKGRIKEGYTVEQLKKAVDGCLCSPWHRGQNPNGVVYDDITLICRDATKVDQFVDMSARYGGGEDEAQDQYLEEVVQQTIERRKRVRRGIGKRGEN